MSSTTEQLKPCPCCGEQPKQPKKRGGSDERCGYNFTIEINCNCGLSMTTRSSQDKIGWCDDNGQALKSAIENWNRRTPPGATHD